MKEILIVQIRADHNGFSHIEVFDTEDNFDEWLRSEFPTAERQENLRWWTAAYGDEIYIAKEPRCDSEGLLDYNILDEYNIKVTRKKV